MARVGDNDEDALIWLLQNNLPDMAKVAIKIREVKNEIDANNNDMHRISPD